MRLLITVAGLALLTAVLGGCTTPIAGLPQAAPDATSSAATSGPAVRSPNDEAFLRAAARIPGTGVDSEGEIRRANGVCGLFQDDFTFQQVTDGLMANGFTVRDSGSFAGLAVAWYCPELAEKIKVN